MSDDFRVAVYDRWGDECVVCGRSPDSWLDTTAGTRRQEKLSLHHINGDETDDRVENVIPVCQSCHVHIHRVDEPPYRKWHRQLPLEHRHAWNEHHKEYYEGPRLTRAAADRRFGDEGGTPESLKYLRHEQSATDRESVDDEVSTGSTGREPLNRPREITVAYTPSKESRHRIRFVDRCDGSGWWRVTDEWTGCTWRPVGREPVSDVEVTIDRERDTGGDNGSGR
ncbi:HNH endonuclease [Halosimplex rubrum]|uniref:HNH endonuclease n=1 Tax=Halosimplex rubrum TaxID=869889 RepID=A0A7D5P448_9EURY|nr:HNH endonuclease signature motif containing protein [Halosimplex rubrum]QLH76918.1 HNH endonuclease [Halosimplex rubrum]